MSDILADKLYQIDLMTSRVHGVPVERTYNQRMEDLVYDPQGRQVIWIDTGNGTLRSKVLDSGGAERVIFAFSAGMIK